MPLHFVVQSSTTSVPSATATRSPTGSTWLLVALAALPFVAKAVAIVYGPAGYVGQSVYKLFQFAAPVVWRRQFDGCRGASSLWPIDEPRPNAATWTAAVAVALALATSGAVAIRWGAALLDVDPIQLRADWDQRFALSPWQAAAAVVYLFTLNAALEELHFRAWLDREIAARWGDIAGIGGSATAFAAMHLFAFFGMRGASPLVLSLVFAALAVAGAAWSWLARRPGGIHAAWLSHGLTDAGLLTWGLFWLGYF
jgi:membrane protease YdiL (CAAX protease family)